MSVTFRVAHLHKGMNLTSNMCISVVYTSTMFDNGPEFSGTILLWLRSCLSSYARPQLSYLRNGQLCPARNDLTRIDPVPADIG